MGLIPIPVSTRVADINASMKTAIIQNQIQEQRGTSATRIAASTFGGIVSIAGVMHGCFEFLQGDVPQAAW